MRRRVAALVLPLVLSACGTTAPMAGPASTGSSDLGPETVGGAAAADRTAEVRATAVVPRSPRQTDAEGASRGGLRRTVGLSPGTLRVGSYYFDAESTNALTSSVTPNSQMGDMRAQQRAVAAWINRHGGVGGRRLELVQHRYDIQGNPSTEAQSLCSAWTEDTGVFAGIGSLPTSNPVLVSCLAKARTVSIGGSSSNVGTDADFRRWAPYYYAPASIELVTAGRLYAQALLDRAFFPRGARVGVLYVETPEHEAALRQGLLPTLATAGTTPTDVAGVAYDGSLADYGNLVSQVQSATLRFRSRGVTHVLFVDTGGALAYWFMQQAQSQGWAPRYGLSTLSAPAFQEASVDPRQLRGAVAVGWRPADDVGYRTALPANAARELCRQIMKEAGQLPRSAFDLQLQLTTCSGFFFLKAALDRATALTPAAFQAAAASLGTTNAPSASGFTDRYAPGKAWGGSGYAVADFRESCRCFRYDGRRRAL